MALLPAVLAMVPVAVPASTPIGAAVVAGARIPDFSAVRNEVVARRLVAEGRLVRIYYFPVELGGPDDPMNIGYVTPEAEEARTAALLTIARLLDEGLVDRLNIRPDYREESLVPSRITMRAWHGEEDDGAFEVTVEVW